jgi:hypothetical protein
MNHYFINVLSDEQYQYVLNKTLYGNEWKLSGYSNANTSEYKFWYMDLNEDNFFTNEFMEIIQFHTHKRFELLNVYANGQTYGLPGNLHKDYMEPYTPELYKTFIYYVNPVWEASWNGTTVILNDDNTADTIFPSKNAGLMFNSNLSHVGNEPSRYCPEMRVTVAFKLKEII